MLGKLNTEMMRSVGRSIESLMGTVELLRRMHVLNRDRIESLESRVSELEERDG